MHQPTGLSERSSLRQRRGRQGDAVSWERRQAAAYAWLARRTAPPYDVRAVRFPIDAGRTIVVFKEAHPCKSRETSLPLSPAPLQFTRAQGCPPQASPVQDVRLHLALKKGLRSLSRTAVAVLSAARERRWAQSSLSSLPGPPCRPAAQPLAP